MSEIVPHKGKKLFVAGDTSIRRGRKKGSKGKTTQIIEALEKELGLPKTISNLRKVFQQTINQALDGDVACQKILWDRFMPVSRFEKGAASQAPMININIGETTPNTIVPTVKVEPLNGKD